MSRPRAARQYGEATLVAAGSTMEEEFREFVAARSGALLRTAFLLAGDWATAEDLLQTALTKTYLAWKRLGQIEAVEPYARRVLVNTATSWWRRRWHGERPTEVLPERPEPDRLAEHLERDAMWQHVKALPVRQRAVLVLRFYEDLSEAQTAATLGISVGTVKSQTSRALASLRQRLSADGTRAPAHGSETGGRGRRSLRPGATTAAATDVVDRDADVVDLTRSTQPTADCSPALAPQPSESAATAPTTPLQPAPGTDPIQDQAATSMTLKPTGPVLPAASNGTRPVAASAAEPAGSTTDTIPIVTPRVPRQRTGPLTAPAALESR